MPGWNSELTSEAMAFGQGPAVRSGIHYLTTEQTRNTVVAYQE